MIYYCNLLTIEEKRKIRTEKLTLRQLKLKFPEFDWTEFVQNGIFHSLANITLSDNETIYLSDFEYIKNAIKIFSQELNNNKKNLDNLFIWVFVYFSREFLPKKFNVVPAKYSKLLRNHKKYSATRMTGCIDSVSDLMEFAVGRLYVDNLDLKIGYPDNIFNNTHMTEIYREYKMNNFNFFANNILINQILVRQNLQELGKKVDRKIWLMGPAVVNAYYSAQFNQICFPAGILQAPFYDSSVPNYLNYGGIGAVIGHEITHGFDDKGRNFDKNGVYHEDGLGDLWTNKTIDSYKSRAKCIVDQYNNFLIKQINKTMNGNQTQGENIADNGGLKESFRAYKRWENNNGKEPLLPGLNFNQDQLFYINFGQVWCSKYKASYLEQSLKRNVHSVGEFRVKGTTMNMKAFSNTFNCKPGQQNNPINKYKIRNLILRRSGNFTFVCILVLLMIVWLVKMKLLDVRKNEITLVFRVLKSQSIE
ncbi:neprilysin-2 isoform X1 [Brachionus plicatilis]|uniref:Neprilysin-2 isoform X1 n=1 Tax=Brachionus plicatilis TaxID=10195 RepID=A0A3M7QBR3_BRAPC|nr:neprilysin-2 isoform X1 [Brachionus plicatilis]